MGFIIIVVFVAFVVFSLSFIKFIACTVWSMVVLFERQPKPKGPPGFSKEGGGGIFTFSDHGEINFLSFVDKIFPRDR